MEGSPVFMLVIYLFVLHLCSVFSVDVPCECHINAECYRGDAGKKICVCKLGFVGDGKRCQGFLFNFYLNLLLA